VPLHTCDDVHIVYVSNKAEPIYLSKEEVGEILVRETERRRLSAGAETPQLPRLKPPTTTCADRTCLKYEDVLRQQLKTFSARTNNSWENVNTPSTGCEKPKMQGVLNCQPNTLRPWQQDDQTKATGVFELCSGNFPGRTTPCNSSCATVNSITITATCTPKTEETVESSRAVGYQISNDSCVVQPCNNSAELDADVTSFQAVPATGTAKKKKTVTFSDDVELVASASDVADQVDYMTYAASIGRHVNSSCEARFEAVPLPTTVKGVDMSSGCCADFDIIGSDSSDEVDFENSVTPSRQARCSLCRQKWVDLTDTYCSDCSFYLSRLQTSQ